MIKVILCDDDKSMLDFAYTKIAKEFESYKRKYMIERCADGGKCLEKLQNNTYDIIFLDINMPKVSGVEIAKYLEEQKKDVCIVFLSNREEMVFETIRYRPFRFVRKSKMLKELEETIASFMKKLENDCIIYEFKTDRKPVKILIKEIKYIESNRHYLEIHTENKTERIRGTMKEYEEKLDESGFIRIHKGFLVNVRFIASVSSKGVSLDDGQLLPVSRSNLEQIKEKYRIFVRRYLYGNC